MAVIFARSPRYFSIPQFPNELSIKFELTIDNNLEYTIIKNYVNGRVTIEYAELIRDFINIEKYTHEKSVIVVDDIFPNHINQASRKRKTRVWTGDIWKIPHCLRSCRPDLYLDFLNTSPSGLLIITKLDKKNEYLASNYDKLIED